MIIKPKLKDHTPGLTALPDNAWLANFSWRVVDLFFPPLCCHCGCLGSEICTDCFNAIELVNQSRYCARCGHRLHRKEICPRSEIFFDAIHSWGYYSGPLKSVIHKLKYHQGIGLVRYLTPHLVVFIQKWYSVIDAIIPLPLGKKREHQRGYNQTAMFAKPVARELGLLYIPGAVKRIRETPSQVGLSSTERKTNVRDAFLADENLINNKHILLFDDITTTGSTINECAKALKLAKAASVSCFTLAKAGN